MQDFQKFERLFFDFLRKIGNCANVDFGAMQKFESQMENFPDNPNEKMVRTLDAQKEYVVQKLESLVEESDAEVRKSCRHKKCCKQKYVFAKIGFDTTEVWRRPPPVPSVFDDRSGIHARERATTRKSHDN